MKEYRVECWRHQHGCYYISAPDAETAFARAERYLFEGSAFDSVTASDTRAVFVELVADPAGLDERPSQDKDDAAK